MRESLRESLRLYQYPPPLLCFISGLIAISLAPARDRFGSLWLALVMVLLGVEQSGVQVLWVIPAIGLGYYHLCPDQAVFSFMQAPLSLPWIKRFFRIQPHR
jgi:glucose dehydrogenase